MSDLSRRSLLRLTATGLAGVVVPGCLGGCTRDAEVSTGGARDQPTASPSASPQPVLAPFDPTLAAGPGTDLGRRVGWASTSDAEIFVAFGKGIETAARERGLEYRPEQSAGDPERNVAQLRSFVTSTGAFAVQPLDPAAQAAVLEEALELGVCVQGIITHPSTLQIAANQYEIGFAQGKGAADWAVARLGGQAEVHYFDLDALSPQLRRRHQGVLDGLKTGGDGIRVVRETSNANEGAAVLAGYKTMMSVIQEHKQIRIVLGGDAAVLGAYQALEVSGKLSDEFYLAGVDGDAAALALIRRGTPYRASYAFAWTLMGYGMGQFAADWIDGKQIPRVMVAENQVLDSASRIDAFLADNAHPQEVFADPQRYGKHCRLLGNVSHATRETVWHQAYEP